MQHFKVTLLRVTCFPTEIEIYLEAENEQQVRNGKWFSRFDDVCPEDAYLEVQVQAVEAMSEEEFGDIKRADDESKRELSELFSKEAVATDDGIFLNLLGDEH